MLRQERHPHAVTDLVIRTATAGLAILTGVGIAFAFWAQLEHTARPELLTAAVVSICLGALLIGVAMQSLSTRVFLWLAAATLAVAFFAGSGAFAALSS